jgi:hypothetical protein
MRPNTVLTTAALLIALAPALSAQSTGGWLLGPEGASCDEACPRAPDSNESTCYVDSMKEVTSPVLFERVMSFLNLTNYDCSELFAGSYPEDPSFYKYSTTLEPLCIQSSELTSCAGSDLVTSRLCCCGGACPIDYTPKWISAGVSVQAPLAHWTFDGYVCP